ncbi:TetR/AcrR family transcriptional regulator [Neptunicella marina]|uniref:TetR/AcrR family transcriptional regulator n=1 Tax=Neptunicella marina TaxID=2125989 RepID=A0A8J6J1H2_9ALTE|nr:TetR/AcrR family transcriptional regulator [Neptunicella marina]MBC3767837.1 TetR/AcrR family transcriptional regulator [Neptunicella marina]
MSITTKTEILDAAEVLFAEHGFADTSLRAITTKANVNLASVNYHFGSKKMLIQEVLKRYLDILAPVLENQLIDLTQRVKQPTMDQVFDSLVAPLLLLNKSRKNGTAIFVQLLGRGYSESQGHLRKYIQNYYGSVLKRFVHTVHLAAPHLDDSEIFWRLHFAIGTFVFTMASSKALSEIADADYQQQVSIEDIIHRLIPYIAAGTMCNPLQMPTAQPKLDIA